MATLKRTSFNTNESIVLPKGTTAQRPNPASQGMIRYNTDTNATEFYDGTNWINITLPVGTDQANPATSASQIYDDNNDAGDGPYWYQHEGVTYQAYTKFNWHQNEHWVAILKVHNRGDMPSGSAYWTNNEPWNWNDFNLLSNMWSKYYSYLYYPFNHVLLDMNGIIPAIMNFTTARTMVDAMNLNSVGNGNAYGSDSQTPSLGTSVRYFDSSFYFSGTDGQFGDQSGSEDYVMRYGINTWANNGSQQNPDNAGHSHVARAGARIGCPLDNGSGYTQGNTTFSGSDSGFGFGGGAGNPGRTWSCGVGEWSNSGVVEAYPGIVWVR